MVKGDGNDKTASSDLALPPRPMEEEADRREVPLPWATVPVALVLGTVAGGWQVLEATRWAGGHLPALMLPGLRALAVGAATCALAAAPAIADRALPRWRRELRWPLATVALGAVAAAVLGSSAQLRWLVIGMRGGEAALLGAVGGIRGGMLALLLALLCRSQRGLVWKALVVGVAVEIVLFEAYLPLKTALIASFQSMPAGPTTLQQWWLVRLWRPLNIVLGNMGLLKLCPAALALMVSVGGTLHWARTKAGIARGEARPTPRWRVTWQKVTALLLLGVIGSVGAGRLGRVVVWRAAVRQDVWTVRAWLWLGVDPDRSALPDRTLPLIYAASRGDVPVTQALLQAGADPNARDRDGCAPLDTALWRDMRVTDLLLAYGADPDAADADGSTPLHRAARNDAVLAAKTLLEAGANPSPHEARRSTPLHYAVGHGNVGFVQALLNAGADINARGSGGYTPLHLVALHWSSPEMVETLLAGAPDPNVRDDNGDTALHIAAGLAHDTVVKALILGGADTELEDALGRTSAELARQQGHPRLAAMIEELAEAQRASEEG